MDPFVLESGSFAPFRFRHDLAREASHAASRQVFLDAVAHCSVISWQHINLLGEYDFRTKSCRITSESDPQN